MPKKSRIRRLRDWLSTTFHSFTALFYPRNLKNAFSNVTKNWKEYICFYLAALAMGAGFWTVTLCTEANLADARERVESSYDYHAEVIVPDNETYANLDNVLSYELRRENEYLASYYWAYDEEPLPDGRYVVRLVFTDVRGLDVSYIWVKAGILQQVPYETVRFSPLYTFEEDFVTPYTAQLWIVTIIWFAFSVLMMLLLFYIRLDHFRFIYGIYMTFGADFPRLMGAAGGELTVITGLTCLPAALIGGGITAALYIPAGVVPVLTVRAALIALIGSLTAVFVSVWYPMRYLSKRAPVLHLRAGDNTSLVSSPRRSFFLFGETFPGKYELYSMWRMRKYYIRLVLSAILFAAVFVSGLYAAEMVDSHNALDPGEYILTYTPVGYAPPDEEIETDEAGNPVPTPGWKPDDEEAILLWEDVALFLGELNAVPGVSHAEWKVSLPGGHTASHLLLKPGQLYASRTYTVPSEERASEGYRWAMNNYAYTAIDEAWIENMTKNGLCTFDGDPYAALTEEKHIIISEDIYNKQTYDFAPGDQILVAVCEEVFFKELVTDPRELLRGQIRDNKFRYETYTVAAVMRGMDSESYITVGVPYEEYHRLTGNYPVRDHLTVYMKNGTDLDTVRSAEGELRRILTPFVGWSVTPTGNYFESSVKALKNDNAVILTLAAALLCISPMIWYFSQILFYRKRRGEFALLRALGAKDSAFGRMHRLVGGVLSGCAFLVTILLTLGLNYIIYFTVNTFLPKMGLTESVHYDYGLSLPALIACILVSVLCGYLSCELPYRMYARRDVQKDSIDI